MIFVSTDEFVSTLGDESRYLPPLSLVISNSQSCVDNQEYTASKSPTLNWMCEGSYLLHHINGSWNIVHWAANVSRASIPLVLGDEIGSDKRWN
jgi:hypothetical protein